MKAYLISLGVGVLVGIAYALLRVRSPAPPAIALVGLLGMVLGEQLLPVARSYLLAHKAEVHADYPAREATGD
jgi:XapX domain-containing protein